MKVEKVPIDKIKIINRVREDYGDMEILKSSISKYGLLNPIIIDPEYRLIAGARRLKAAKELGFTSIEASVVGDLTKVVKFDMEMQENLVRKDFTEDEIDKSIEMKKRLLKKPWYLYVYDFFKNLINSFLSLFKKK